MNLNTSHATTSSSTAVPDASPQYQNCLRLTLRCHQLIGRGKDLRLRYDALLAKYHTAVAALHNKEAVRRLAAQVDARWRGHSYA